MFKVLHSLELKFTKPKSKSKFKKINKNEYQIGLLKIENQHSEIKDEIENKN
jgi:hypothetical protein